MLCRTDLADELQPALLRAGCVRRLQHSVQLLERVRVRVFLGLQRWAVLARDAQECILPALLAVPSHEKAVLRVVNIELVMRDLSDFLHDLALARCQARGIPTPRASLLAGALLRCFSGSAG